MLLHLALLNRTKTPMGKTLLKRWLLQPSLELNVLNARFDAVDCFSLAENSHIAENLHKSLTVKNIPRVIKSLIAGVNSVASWQALSTVS
jgi:DNA mismatch repair protein MSH5